MTTSSPYSVYVESRPVRIAFIINPATAHLDLITRIATYSQQLWGGRFHPIVMSDGVTMGESDWALLEAVDPDIVRSLVPLDSPMVTALDSRLSPYAIESVPSNGNLIGQVPGSPSGLSVVVDSKAIADVSNSFHTEVKYILFETTTETEPVLDRFLQVNFGTRLGSSLPQPDTFHDRNLRIVPTTLPVTDRTSLATHLAGLADFGRRVYPTQLAATGSNPCEPDPSGSAPCFRVVVGDAPGDVCGYWNHILELPHWMRTRLWQLWLPTSLAQDESLVPALREWIGRAADPGGTGHEDIEFVSTSLNTDTLMSIGDNLTKGKWLRRLYPGLSEPPRFGPRYIISPKVGKNVDVYRAIGHKERFRLSEPPEGTASGSDTHWMADVYIQHEWEGRISTQSSCLVLPQRNVLAHRIFMQPSRIRSGGLPCALMTHGDPELTINSLDSHSVFYHLMVGTSGYYLKNDPRSKLAGSPFGDMQRSDKGRYLSGLIELFGGLHVALHYLQDRYWREVFLLLSKKNPAKDDQTLAIVTHTLDKTIQRHGHDFITSPDGIQWLADYVLRLSREQSLIGPDLPLARLRDLAKKENQDYYASVGEAAQFDDELFKEILSRLAARNILLLGVKQSCNRCGTKNWYHVDNLHQQVECPGCGDVDVLRVEPPWSYKLNTLVQSGFSHHGLLTVLLVLAHLEWQSTSSFLYYPCLDLFKHDQDLPFGDLDIVCISDGRFIVGEVKESVGQFTPSDFEKMAEVALALKPDMLLFAALTERPTARVLGQVKQLQEKLRDHGVEVRWLSLPGFYFEPSAVC